MKENEELLVLELNEEHGSVIKHHEFAGCSALKMIELPKGIEVIGDYAFYRCVSLEEIHLYAGVKRLGCGAFMGCKKVKKIVVRDIGDDLHFLTELLYDLQYEVEIELHYRNGAFAKLIFPEYYEEAVENTPARIVDIVYHGSGYQYRQCFRNRQLDYEKYDSLFSYALAKGFSATCIRLALDRLCTPLDLKEQAKERYLSYLREEGAELAKKVCAEDDTEAVKQLAGQGYFTKEMLEIFQRQAADSGRAEIAAYLLNYRLTHYRVKKKSFDFDE